MSNRREFLKQLALGTAACVATPVMSLFKGKFPDRTADEINELLYFRGLRPCPHSYHSSDEDFAGCGYSNRTRRAGGFVCLNPDAMICRNCSKHRKFFFNEQGLRIWRCGSGCEDNDLRAWLHGRGDTSIQFLANMRKMPEDLYDRFLRTLRTKIIAIMAGTRQHCGESRSTLQPVDIGSSEFGQIGIPNDR